MNFLKRNGFILLFIAIVIFFFKPFIVEGKLPIPSDTIIGLYHPFRDFYAKEYPRGVAFKNFLITDPVRQQYPWRELAMDLVKKSQLPFWNPYAMAGYPLAGNLQSAVFYPLNVLFFLFPFSAAWSMLILLQPLLAGIFLYLYLRNINLRKEASLLGSSAFAFSGFSIAWMEWGTILHSALWLPLILLSIDKVFLPVQARKIYNFKWPAVFIFSLACSFFAGHLQTFFYAFLFSLIYFFARWWQHGRNRSILLFFVLCSLFFLVPTAIQWVPTFQLIGESARDIDQVGWEREGWFIPWQHLVQFIAPDFFGNPATGNYWGVWNYGEFVGYIGMLPLLMAFFAILARRDKKTAFFAGAFITSLLFALPTIIAKLPYMLSIPFLSTAQPTRLLFITDFSLSILAALGFDYILKATKKIWYSIGFIGIIILGLWLIVFMGKEIMSIENAAVANNNLLLPTALIIVSAIIFFLFRHFQRNKNATLILYCIIVGITAFDLIRFGWKFTPFTNQEYLFPSTSTIKFLQQQEGQFRIMAIDDRILPANFSVIYRLQSVSGYDPLYLQHFGELIAASERGEPNISPPLGFNRIITPHNYESKIIDLLGVKYILSLSDIESTKLTKVFQEGETRIYENKNALSRVFFVELVYRVNDKQRTIEHLFEKDFQASKAAVVEEPMTVHFGTFVEGKAEITDYSVNRIIVRTKNDGDGFLVLTDSFYPTWKATVDGVSTKIYKTDYNFRGVSVPKGDHKVEFHNSL